METVVVVRFFAENRRESVYDSVTFERQSNDTEYFLNIMVHSHRVELISKAMSVIMLLLLYINRFRIL